MKHYLLIDEHGTILAPGRGPMTREQLDKLLALRLDGYNGRKACGHPALPARVAVVEVINPTTFHQQVTEGVTIP